jgi:hypothetical protein
VELTGNADGLNRVVSHDLLVARNHDERTAFFCVLALWIGNCDFRIYDPTADK